MALKIECVVECENYLGESPIWDVESGMLYWVDGTGQRKGKNNIFKLNPRTGEFVSRLIPDHDIGALALRKNGGLILAVDDGFYFYDFDRGDLELIQLIEQDLKRTRLNDGKVDRRGRFIAGSMDDQEELDICGLWRLDPDLSVTKIGNDIICTNGPSWSPDDKVFYVTCTFKDIMWAYDYDINTGTISNRREFLSTKELSGVCDGSTVDADGCIWTAELVSGDIVRRTPDGKEDWRIGMPVKNVTSVMFGGDELDEIYVTSMARIDHPGSKHHDTFITEEKPQFGAGSVFKISGLGIRGVPEPRFGG